MALLFFFFQAFKMKNNFKTKHDELNSPSWLSLSYTYQVLELHMSHVCFCPVQGRTLSKCDAVLRACSLPPHLFQQWKTFALWPANATVVEFHPDGLLFEDSLGYYRNHEFMFFCRKWSWEASQWVGKWTRKRKKKAIKSMLMRGLWILATRVQSLLWNPQ
jgi:hypothetical protein